MGRTENLELMLLYHEDGILFPTAGKQVQGLQPIITYLHSSYGNAIMHFTPHFKEMTSRSGYEYGHVAIIKTDINQSVYEGYYSIVWIRAEMSSWKIMSHILSDTESEI